MTHSRATYAPETERVYAQRFGAWCRYAVERGQRALPADTTAVVEYLRDLVDRHRALSTVSQAACAIALMHRRAGHAPPDVQVELARLLQRARRSERRDAARTRTLTVRLTDAELERLQSAAAAEKVSVRRLARERLLAE